MVANVYDENGHPVIQCNIRDITERKRAEMASIRLAAIVESSDDAKRTVLFRVAQEALTNVARHAQASRVEVIFQKLPEGICMKIKDDGKSFQVDRVLHWKGSKHLGLLGIRERLEMVGGGFEIESAPGKGTTITARIPSCTPARGAR